MTDTEANVFPDQPDEQAAETVSLDEQLNPFAGDQTLPVSSEGLDLSGRGILGSNVGVVPVDPGNTGDAAGGTPPSGERIQEVERAAHVACSLLAEAFVTDNDPSRIVFPDCDDMNVISATLRQLVNTPLGLGFGNFSQTISAALTRFVHETAANYRLSHQLGPADLVPVAIALPDWIRENPHFDVLESCTLMDITLTTPVDSVLAAKVSNCRLVFEEEIGEQAQIGKKAQRCTFVFKKDLRTGASFGDAANVIVDIQGSYKSRGGWGVLGAMKKSKVTCAGSFEGKFHHKWNTGCVIGPGVKGEEVS